MLFRIKTVPHDNMPHFAAVDLSPIAIVNWRKQQQYRPWKAEHFSDVDEMPAYLLQDHISEFKTDAKIDGVLYYGNKSRTTKLRALSKDIIGWQVKIERLVLDGKLYLGHKLWMGWCIGDKDKTHGWTHKEKKKEIDAILDPVNGGFMYHLQTGLA